MRPPVDGSPRSEVVTTRITQGEGEQVERRWKSLGLPDRGSYLRRLIRDDLRKAGKRDDG